MDLLVDCWETGCRPQEVLVVEVRHVDLDDRRCVFALDEAKGRWAHRLAYVTDRVLQIPRRLMERPPAGPLFRNSDARRWHPLRAELLVRPTQAHPRPPAD
jgi:hypothetical protein